MTLDKRTGLYKVPAHHLHDAQPVARPTFNSMDYEDADGTDEQDVDLPSKKRKFQSEETPAAPKTGLAGLGAVFNGEMVAAVKARVKSAKEAFGSSQPASEFAAAASAAAAAALAPASEPAEKKVKKAKWTRKSLDVVDFDRMAKETRKINKKERKMEEKEKRKSLLEGEPKFQLVPDLNFGRSSPPVFSTPPRKTPVPLPTKTFSRAANALVPDPNLSDSPPIFSTPPRKTPVPLPPKASSRAANVPRTGRPRSRNLVLKSPPELWIRPDDLPANLPDTPSPQKVVLGAKSEESHKSKSGVASTSSSSSTISSLILPPPFPSSPPQLRLSSPIALPSPSRAPLQELAVLLDGRVALTAANLIRYTTLAEPFNDEPTAPPPQLARNFRISFGWRLDDFSRYHPEC